MNIAIIGAGLMCKRRAPVLIESPDSNLKVIASKHYSDAIEMANKFNCEAVESWEEVITNKNIDAVIVSTPPSMHAEISIAALKAGKHVLCEKPLTKELKDSEEMVKTAKNLGLVLKCGFNHRLIRYL